MYRCMGKKMKDKEITPKAIGKIRKGNFYLPDCPNYEPRVNIPKKVRIDEIFTGWHCRNCKNLNTS